jgi:hypothetical protein
MQKALAVLPAASAPVGSTVQQMAPQAALIVARAKQASPARGAAEAMMGSASRVPLECSNYSAQMAHTLIAA